MESEAKNFLIYITSIPASLSYCYYVSSKIPKGIYRFLSLTPIFYLFTILPLRFSFVFTTALSASFTTWLSNFKLIRFAFDLQPSPFHHSQSLLQFITFISLPIKPKSNVNDTRSCHDQAMKQDICRQSYLYHDQIKTQGMKNFKDTRSQHDQVERSQSYLCPDLIKTQGMKNVNDTLSHHDQGMKKDRRSQSYLYPDQIKTHGMKNLKDTRSQHDQGLKQVERGQSYLYPDLIKTQGMKNVKDTLSHHDQGMKKDTRRQSYLYQQQIERQEMKKIGRKQSYFSRQIERLLPEEKNQSSIFKLLIHIAIFTILANTILNYRGNFSKHYILVIYCVMLYLIIDIISAFISVLFFLSTGLELEQPSNDPYFATSLQDFWARWNLMVTNTLRHTIYKPVRTALSDYKWAPLAGVMASFVVSGLMHELFVFQLSREPPTWEMTLFFVLHGICVVVEMVAKRVVMGGRRWRLPEFFATVLTVGFVVATGFWLFFPPLIRSGVDVKILQEYTWVVEFLKAKLFVF